MLRQLLLLAVCIAPFVTARSVEQERLTLDKDAEFVPRRQIDAVEIPAETDGERPASPSDTADEGRQLGIFPRVRIFRIPPLFRTSIFPDFGYPPARRPSISSSFAGTDEEAEPARDPDFSLPDLFSGFDLGMGRPSLRDRNNGDKRVGVKDASDVEGGAGEAGSPDADTFDVDVPATSSRPTIYRRPVFTSLSDMFGDFNRRMQSFEEDIANMFRTLVRVPDRSGEREPSGTDAEVIPDATSDAGAQDEEEETGPDTSIFGSRPRPSFGFDLFRPFRPVFGSGGLFPGFRNPAEYPDTYKNSTSKTEVINGTRVMVNETITKGGDENSSHFVHFKVIHLLPEDAEDKTEGPAVVLQEGQSGFRDVEQVTEKTTAAPAVPEVIYDSPTEESGGEFMAVPTAEMNEVEWVEPIDRESFMRDADVGAGDNFRTVAILGSDLDVNQARFKEAKRRGLFEPNPDAQLVGRRHDYVPTQLLDKGPWQ